jgi:hypothetical protein
MKMSAAVGRWLRPWQVVLLITAAYVGMTLARFEG